METWKVFKEGRMMSFLQKSWKFILGALAMLFGILLFFRKNSDDAEIIKETTESGNKALEGIISSNKEKNKKIKVLEKTRAEKVKIIEEEFLKNKERISPVLRKKIKNALDNGEIEKVTDWLATSIGVKNLD